MGDLTQSFGHLRFAHGLRVLLKYTLAACKAQMPQSIAPSHPFNSAFRVKHKIKTQNWDRRIDPTWRTRAQALLSLMTSGVSVTKSGNKWKCDEFVVKAP